MKRAFTLVEMLITITVLAILMTIVFKLVGVSDEEAARMRTIVRLQRLENCLSGYYAAYGSYPPVGLHGSRDIFAEVDENGNRTGNRNTSVLDFNENDSDAEELSWSQVESACRSQPVACNFPYDSDAQIQNQIRMWAEACKESLESGRNGEVSERVVNRYASGFTGLGAGSSAVSSLRQYEDSTSWDKVKVFRFGLMSFLLPRYRFMTSGEEEFYEYAQWTDNNVLPCNPFNGKKYNSWTQLSRLARQANEDENREGAGAKNNDRASEIESIPSQKVCSRWVANLEGICAVNNIALEVKVFGVDIMDREVKNKNRPDINSPSMNFDLYSPYGKSSARDCYVLNGITVLDGWMNDFYYYSPPPYQSYQLWSAGPNGRTFPPWIARDELNTQQNRTVNKWIQDDIIHINN